MKSLSFNLDAVLQLRASAKERAEKTLTLALREREQIENQLKEAKAHLNRLVQECGETTFTVVARQQGWAAICRQEERCKALRATFDQADATAAARRGDLVIAGIDHELVVRLRNKWLAARSHAEANAEERQLEDFVNAQRSKPQADR